MTEPTAAEVIETLNRFSCEAHYDLTDDCLACEITQDIRQAITLIQQQAEALGQKSRYIRAQVDEMDELKNILEARGKALNDLWEDYRVVTINTDTFFDDHSEHRATIESVKK